MAIAFPVGMTTSAARHTDSPAPRVGEARCMPTRRLSDLPAYVFAWLDEIKTDARARGADLLDLGMGNPDQPTPTPIVDAIVAAYRNPEMHGYPPFRGTPRFREAAARFMRARFGVDIDPETEVLCLSGAKEGIAHLTMAFTDEATTTLVPDIYYPVHGRATSLAGGRVHLLPLSADRGFIPDLSKISRDALRSARILVLNYPHNPTGTVAPLELFEEAVALCKANGLILLSDLAYSELTFDGLRAPSALEVPGAKNVTVEFHSFSKSFNMAGSRIGFAVGGAHLIDALHAVRTNTGYGTPAAIQEGAAYALEHAHELAAPIRARIRGETQRADRRVPFTRVGRASAARNHVLLAPGAGWIHVAGMDRAPHRPGRDRRHAGKCVRTRRRRILPSLPDR